MDEALRGALRSDDWSARAAAFRRAGEEDLARREVARAARAGLEDAREALEEFPHDADARALLEVLAAPPDASQRAAWAAQILWGDGDPRLGEAAEAWLDHATQRGLQEAEGGFGHLLVSDYVQRLGMFLGGNGPALERVILSGGEGIALLEGIRGAPSALQLLQLRFLSIACGDRAFLERVAKCVSDHPEGAFVESVVEGATARAGGWRPSWVRPTHRCHLTLALLPHSIRGRHMPPGVFELPPCEWVFLFKVDALRDHNEASGHIEGDALLRAVVQRARSRLGDRIVRWRMNQFLVPLEGPDGVAQAQDCIGEIGRDATLASTGGGSATISGALAPRAFAESQASWAEVLDEGLYRARTRGRGILEVLGA